MNRLPAHLTSEDDWKQDQPGVRLSRVFGVVLGIHIIAIGGLMAYEMFRHNPPSTANPSAFRPAARDPRPGTAAAASEARTADVFADDPAHEGMRKHVVASGERLGEIAALYGVDEKALMVKNRLGEGRGFYSGMKLVIPNQQLQAGAPVAPDRLLAAATPPASPLESPLPAATPAPPSETAADGLVPVSPAPYDPSLPTRRAEAVAEPAVAKSTAKAIASKATTSKATTPKTASSKAARAEQSSARPPGAAKTAPVVASAPKKSAPAAKKQETAATKPKAKGRVHVVKDGETAYRIAKAYGVNVDQLIKTNGINPNALRPGTTLSIPGAR